jgi:hypothetical protein
VPRQSAAINSAARTCSLPRGTADTRRTLSPPDRPRDPRREKPHVVAAALAGQLAVAEGLLITEGTALRIIANALRLMREQR